MTTMRRMIIKTMTTLPKTNQRLIFPTAGAGRALGGAGFGETGGGGAAGSWS